MNATWTAWLAAFPQDTGEQKQLLFQNMPEAWVLGLVVAPGLLALAFLAYRKPKRKRLIRRILAGLRIALLAVAVFLVLGPFLRESRTQTEPAPLSLLFDDSASLQRKDRLERDAIQRLAEMGLAGAGDPKRLEVVQAIAASPWRQTLEQRYQLQAYRFSDRLVPTAVDGSSLAAQGAATDLGSALMQLLRENRGRRLPDVVLFSDGRSNQGPPVETAADRLAAEGVRVHVVALGDPEPAPDLALERVQSPEVVLVQDEALFVLRLLAQGGDLPAQARVRLREEDGTLLAETEVPIQGPGGTQFTMSPRLDRPGFRTLVAEVEPLDQEIARDNNRLELPVEVKDVKIRILYVDGKPRWEYRYIKERLVRSGNDLSVQVYLADADRDFLQEKSRQSTLDRLRRIPDNVEDLLERYDVIVIGDVDPSDLNPDPLVGPRFIDAVAEFVRRGGGLLMTAGPRHNPSTYRGTALEPLLPVILGREPKPANAPFQALPSDPDFPHPTTLLDENPRLSYQRWESQELLWWYVPVERLRPGAQAWLLHSEVENRHGPHVLAAGGYVPEGWVGWLGTDETWRWRFPHEERFLDRWWRAMVRHLASGRLRSEDGRARLDVDRNRIELGESVLVEARLRDEAFQPLVLEEGVNLFLEGRENPIPLSPVPDQAGIYRGQVRGNAQGPKLIYLTEDGTADGPVLAQARFQVVLPSKELRETSQDQRVLNLLSERTGGRLVSPDQANRLLDVLDGKDRLKRTLASRDEPLDQWPFLLAFLLLAAAEWLGRKWSNLS
ncbi:MAG: hypothetical protein DWQ01_18875 [Planctomycetota bacterium]|nr:MAG: hypothetical protein DWQ01_18875 [Planctomycetota bacterium]